MVSGGNKIYVYKLNENLEVTTNRSSSSATANITLKKKKKSPHVAQSYQLLQASKSFPKRTEESGNGRGDWV